MEQTVKNIGIKFFLLLLFGFFLSNCDTTVDDGFEMPGEEENPVFDTSYVKVEGIAFNNGDVKNVTFTTADITGNFASLDSNNPISDYGHVWSSVLDLPTVGTPNCFNKPFGERTTRGSFTTKMENLESDEQYYVRAYIIVNDKTYYHDKSVSFSTFRQGLATVDLNEASNITENSFGIDALLRTDGGSPVIAHGFVWSLSFNDPTLDFNEGRVDYANATNNTSFNYQVQSLDHTSSVYIRAYATNAFGTSYSNTQYVRTLSPYVITNGLLAYYRFENDAKDEWGLYDGVASNMSFSSNTNTGTGYAAQFTPSSNSYISVPGNPLFNANSGTVSVWLKSTNSARQCVLHSNNFTNPSGFELVTYGGEVYFNDVYRTDNCNYLYWPQKFPFDLSSLLFDGNWHLLTITIEPGEQKLFIDGTRISKLGDSPGLEKTNQPAITIGRYYEGCSANHYFNGFMDNLRIYNRVVTEAEIREIYLKKQ